MKQLLLLSVLLFLVSFSEAKNLTEKFSYQSYEEARNGDNLIEFHMESTKAGLFTSSFIGVIKKFTMLAQVEQNQLTTATFDFAVLDMDTDHQSRNRKMYDKCFNHEQYPRINVAFTTPAIIGEETLIDAIMTVRGAPQRIKILLDTRKTGKTLLVSGSSEVKLSALQIPDPSIIVASVRDLVEIQFKVGLELE
jgi:polyisoprenoid-binding protein YceI